MQIACERCATVYVLDDKLIPPNGAPVQCTRCGLVFTAKPPAGAPAAPPAPKPTAPPASAQAFAPRAGTQIFGSAPASAAPAPAGQPSAHSTQMFGAVPAPSAPAPARAASFPTQTFGSPALHGSPAPQPEPNRSAHSTQLFGAPAAAPASSSATLAFGALAASAAAAPPAAAPSQPVHATQMFGAVAPAAPSTAQAGSSPSVRSTQVFGALGQAPASPSGAVGQTQTFGAVSAPSPSQAVAPAPTPMFGSLPSTPRPTFGSAPAADPDAGARAPDPAASVKSFPKSADGGDASLAPGQARPTPMFGAPAASAPGTLASEAPDLAASDPNATIPFGMSPFVAASSVQQAAVDKTLLFGTSAPGPAAQPSQPVPSWQASPAGQSGEAAAPRAPRSSLEMPKIADPAPAASDATTIPGALPEVAGSAPAPLPTPSWMGQPQAADVAQTPAFGTQSASPRPRTTAERPAPLPMGPVGSQTMELQVALQRSRRRVPLILGGIVLVAAIAGGVAVWFKSQTPMPDPAIVAADDAALGLLRKDDTKSLLAAIEAWKEIEAKAPDYVPAKANQVIAYLLLMQDAREEINRIKLKANQVEKEMARIKEKKATPDWHARANAKRDELVEIKKAHDPLVEQASEYDTKAGELLKASRALVDRTKLDAGAVLRASAIYYAVKGNESAESFAKRYREVLDERKVLLDEPRAFADLAVAALQAQSRVSPEMRHKGIQYVGETLRKDPKVLRAHLLKARLHLASREYAEAKDALTELLVLNPAHSAAAALKEDVVAAEENAKKLAVEDSKK